MALVVGLSTIPIGIILYRIGKKMFLKYQAGRDRSYNVFDKAELSENEKDALNKWQFDIPETIDDFVE